ncbi:UDP-forming cellulose synthase catalytic subunit [Castellaniella sp.]|uniref:UDP-forming cellulose synthase catalytic subunit n=1 Tax=Castellaniella sp. TaxID=1955812 RepID=UPI003A8DD127
MTTLAQLTLTTHVAHALGQRRLQLGRQFGLGPLGARTALVLWVLASLFLRLDAPAWKHASARYGECFRRVRGQRSFSIFDPVRYLVQGVFLLCVAPFPDRSKRGLILTFFCWLQRRIRLTTASVDAVWMAGMTALPDSGVIRHTRLWVRKLGRTGRLLVFGTMSLLAVVLVSLLVTQPFNYMAQFVFVSLLFSLALVVRKIPGRFSLLMLMVLSVTISGRYIWWRYTSTLNWTNTQDLFFGVLLLAAETYSWVVLLLGYIQVAWPLNRQPAPLPTDTSFWPVVDLMIPTYNEDLSVVRPTVYAALGMDWPADRLNIYLLDDGHRESFRAFAQEAGINYISRPKNDHAKAGNLNYALKQTSGDLIAIFDCDHIPTRSFLQLTVGHFLRDPKLALVQTPHHFFSPDPFEKNLGHFGTRPNENTLFYGLVQDGNDLWNAAFFCGSCAVLRRTALDEIGGFAVETVTEDAHTALYLHRAGWNSAYLRIPQAAGLATDSLASHIGQRIRWARGMVQIFRLDNPLLGKGLSLFQRLCYTNAMLHFLSGVPRLIYLTAPLAFLLAHSYIVYAPALAILLNVVPHLLHANVTSSVLQGNYRRTMWGEIYETVLSWYIARPTLVALFAPQKGAFNVTAKGGLIQSRYYDWKISMPYVVLALLNGLGLLFGAWRLWKGPADEVNTVLITMVWVLFNMVILGGALAVAAELRQVRETHRVPTALPACIRLENGHVLTATLSDFSEGGVGVTLAESATVALHSSVRVYLTRGDREFSFPGSVVRSQDKSIGVQLDILQRQKQIDLVQCVFARADAWLAWQGRLETDRPLDSLRGVVRLGISGYYQAARYMPFPISIILRMGAGFAAWLLSFLPHFPSAVVSGRVGRSS